MSTAFAVPDAWKWSASPNHTARTKPVTAIVLHASPGETATLSWIAKSKADLDALWHATPEAKRPKVKYSPVSYHVVIGRDGTVYVAVNPDRRAWHAGTSSFKGRANCNDYSVGVCLINKQDGKEAYPEAQIASAVDVCVHLARHYSVPPAHIPSHAEVSPGRKVDPLGLDMDAFREAVAARLAA